MGWFSLHWIGHPPHPADPWLQSVVNWLTTPFKWLFIWVLGVAAGVWLSPHEWFNVVIGIPGPAEVLGRAEEEIRRRRRISRGLSQADLEHLRRGLELQAEEYGLTLAQAWKICFER